MDRRADLLFRALADPTRLRLVALLARGERCVADLVAVLGVPQPKASRHLACLRRAGFVEARESGTWSFYRLARPASALHRRLLEAARAAPGPGADARRDRDLRRRGGCCP